MSSLIVDVSKINKIEKHPNADRLRIATIKGWQCIIGLSDYNEGDLVIFVPPDCVLPDKIIDDLKLDYLKKGGRVKTVKLRGFISQGLCLPISLLPQSFGFVKEGLNVSEILGIKKYEPPRAHYQGQPRATIKSTYAKYKEGKISFRRFIFKSIGIIKDTFKPKKNLNPLFNKYTDIENIKNFNTVFAEADLVVITEKIHGSNFRSGYLKRPTKYFYQRWLLKLFGEYEFVYGSHNVQLSFGRKKTWYGEDVYGKIAEKYKLAEIIPKDCIIYGEIYGKGIQELEYGLNDIDLVIFDIKKDGKYLDWCEVVEFGLYNKIPVVPVLYTGEYSDEKRIECTNGRSTIAWKNNPSKEQIREGCVVKTVVEDMHRRIGRKILKSVSEKYLLTKNRSEHH